MGDLLAELTDLGCVLDGVRTVRLPNVSDERGSISVYSRPEWAESVQVQWNIGRSAPNVMRGVHLHLVHSDWLALIAGKMFVGLRDLRPESPTRGRSVIVTLNAPGPAASCRCSGAIDGSGRSDAATGEALYIPPGVAHGFYNFDVATYLYGTSTVWSPIDELGCRWDDPALELAWPIPNGETPTLSARDDGAESLAQLLRTVGW